MLYFFACKIVDNTLIFFPTSLWLTLFQTVFLIMCEINGRTRFSTTWSWSTKSCSQMFQRQQNLKSKLTVCLANCYACSLTKVTHTYKWHSKGRIIYIIVCYLMGIMPRLKPISYPTCQILNFILQTHVKICTKNSCEVLRKNIPILILRNV